MLARRRALNSSLRKVMVEDLPVEEQEPAETQAVQAEDKAPESPTSKPALVINVQSWATPIVGLAMLLLGLALGYVGRPLISPQSTGTPAAAVAPTQASGGAASAVSTPTLMEYLISQTRHFKGNPDATVTLIEFSDYQ
jgi:hypothetical protein